MNIYQKMESKCIEQGEPDFDSTPALPPASLDQSTTATTYFPLSQIQGSSPKHCVPSVLVKRH